MSVPIQRIKPTGHFLQQSLEGSGIVIHYNMPPIVAPSSFNDGLNESLWRAHLKPFACAIVHLHSQEIILARDHLGLEPLYYCHHLGKTLIVGQTIPDILKQLASTPPLLDRQIHMLFSEHKYYSDETLYRGIYRVEPGHLMHFKADGTIVKTAFWQLEPHAPLLNYKDDREYLEHFSMLINESMMNATEHHGHGVLS